MQHQFLPSETPIPALSPALQDTQAQNDIQTEQVSALLQRDTQDVTALLTATQRKIRRRKRRFWGAFATFEVALMLFVRFINFSPHNLADFLRPIVMFLPVALAAFVTLLYTVSRPSEFDAEGLGRVGGVRAVPPLIDAITGGRTSSKRQDIYRALVQLLPQLKATDANMLMPRHRQQLNRLLSLEASPNWWGAKETGLSLSLAILKAYEQVGDAKAIPIVGKLAKMPGNKERAQKIRQAAQQCLPLLQSHSVPLGQNQTLLRATTQSNAAPDVLLRPASETSATPAEELLRASG